MNLDVNICSVCGRKNFADSEYVSPLNMCNTCFAQQQAQMLSSMQTMQQEIVGLKTKKEQTPSQPKVKNGISYDQETPIEFKDKVKAWVDEDTDLMWEVKQEYNISDDYSWEVTKELVEYLNNIKYAGFNDWRLPTIVELKTLLTKERNNKIYIKVSLSKNIPKFTPWYWSSTVKENKGFIDTSSSYCVYFDYRDEKKILNILRNKVRCVRFK